MTDEQLDFVGTKRKQRKGRPTYLTPFGDDWSTATGGAVPWGKLAKAVKLIGDATGDNLDQIRARWRTYLKRTPAERCSPIRFAQTYGAWTPERQHGADVDKRLDKEHAKRVRANLAEPRECVDPVAIGSLISDMQRRGKPVPEWLTKAKENI